MATRVFDLYFKNHRPSVKRKIAESVNYEPVYKESMNWLWEKQKELADLPFDAPDRLLLQSVASIVEKSAPDPNDSEELAIKKLELLQVELASIEGQAKGTIAEFARRTRMAVRELTNSAPPPEDDLEGGGGGGGMGGLDLGGDESPEGEGGEETEGGPESGEASEEEEPEETDEDALARELDILNQ